MLLYSIIKEPHPHFTFNFIASLSFFSRTSFLQIILISPIILISSNEWVSVIVLHLMLALSRTNAPLFPVINIIPPEVSTEFFYKRNINCLP